MKPRSGIYFALAVVAVLLLGYAYNEFRAWQVLQKKYPPLVPGKVNLVGLKVPGYRIVVSNGVARLEQGGGDEFGKGDDTPTSGATGSVISMRGLLGTLRFDETAASELTTALAGIKTEIEPLADAIWSESAIAAALSGDQLMADRLERDLCTRLDGSAVGALSWRRLNTGIWLSLKVPIDVPRSKGNIVATVLVPYQTRLAAMTAAEVNKRLTGGRLEPDPALLAGVYGECAAKATAGKEVVSDSLKALTSAEYKAKLAEPVNSLLSGILIIATEQQITNASLTEEDNAEGTGKVYTLSLGLTAESRDRVWQYSHSRVGGQLMLVSNDVAIAAPFIQHEIKYPTITITNIVDEDLAREALSLIQARTPPK